MRVVVEQAVSDVARSDQAIACSTGQRLRPCLPRVSGSPGPAPTSPTVPGAKSCGMNAVLCGKQLGESRAARSAVGAGFQRRADRGDIGELLVGDGAQDRFQSDVETGADDRVPIDLHPRHTPGEQGRDGSRFGELREPIDICPSPGDLGSGRRRSTGPIATETGGLGLVREAHYSCGGWDSIFHKCLHVTSNAGKSVVARHSLGYLTGFQPFGQTMQSLIPCQSS